MPEIMLNGPAGRLEGRYQPTGDDTSPVALFLHPHPRHGGTMNSKTLYALYQVFQSRGFTVMRFNFRGVGKSTGTYDKGEGELSDAAAALDWLQQQFPNARQMWVGGVSFGAWIGMQLLMRRPEIRRFVMVAPPATSEYDFGFLAPCPASGLIIHGEQDEVVPRDGVDKLVKKLRSQGNITIDYWIGKGADHLFSAHLPRLMKVVSSYIDHCLPDAARPTRQAAYAGAGAAAAMPIAATATPPAAPAPTADDEDLGEEE